MCCALFEEVSVRLGFVSPDIGAVFFSRLTYCFRARRSDFDAVLFFSVCVWLRLGVSITMLVQRVRQFWKNACLTKRVQLGSVPPLIGAVYFHDLVCYFQVWRFDFDVVVVFSLWVWLRLSMLIAIPVLHTHCFYKTVRFVEHVRAFTEN